MKGIWNKDSESIDTICLHSKNLKAKKAGMSTSGPHLGVSKRMVLTSDPLILIRKVFVTGVRKGWISALTALCLSLVLSELREKCKYLFPWGNAWQGGQEVW